MKYLVTLFAVIASALALTQQEYQVGFTSWMQSHGKSYNHDEFQTRFNIWKSNTDFIATHNSKNLGFTVAMNQFGDLSLQEFKKLYNGLLTDKINTTVVESASVELAASALPDSWDWRTQNKVTAVKNQEQCGSCWAFSTTGSTESCHALSTQNLVTLSEQNLLDCSWKQGNYGCNGGLMTAAMTYIIANGGIDTEKSYPYTAKDSHTCHYDAANSGATLKSFTNVQRGSESDLQTKVYTGPTSVAIDAGHSSFQFYHSGVYYEAACSATRLDHGVLSVGWGATSSEATAAASYWIVKNSWGTGWGNNGYIWMSRNRNNNCGIATMATLPAC